VLVSLCTIMTLTPHMTHLGDLWRGAFLMWLRCLLLRSCARYSRSHVRIFAFRAALPPTVLRGTHLVPARALPAARPFCLDKRRSVGMLQSLLYPYLRTKLHHVSFVPCNTLWRLKTNINSDGETCKQGPYAFSMMPALSFLSPFIFLLHCAGGARACLQQLTYSLITL